MRLRLLALILPLIGSTLAAAQEPAKPIGPDEARKKVDADVTVRMVVKSSALRGEVAFLNSEEDHRSDKNFTIFIGKDVLPRFRDAKVDDPAENYRGKTIVVKGKVVLYRERPEIAVSGPAEIVVEAPDPKAEMALLEGEWAMVSGEADGAAMPEATVKTGKRVAKDGETSIHLGGRPYFRAKFHIDPSRKPKTIDYDMIEGPTKGKTHLGIYDLDGDTLRFCFAAPGKDRPAEFSAKEGSRNTLSVWKRTKPTP
jgi:uncharacterized protein (TIGR03067 family)